MPLDLSQIQIVAFDLGNTLIPFGPAEFTALDGALHASLTELFGPVDRERLDAWLVEARSAPLAGTPPLFKEYDHPAYLARMVAEVYGPTTDTAPLEQLRFAQSDAFVRIVNVAPHVHEVLSALKQRYKLALLSNFSDANAIRGALRAHNLAPYFEHIVVSGELGYMKPHPVTFAQLLAPFRTPTRHAVYIGDHWALDIQGAKRLGLHAIHTTEYPAKAACAPTPDDLPADHTITHLRELLPLLLP